MMKKLTALMLALVMSLSLLAGCGKDPVAEELFWFANVAMPEVYEQFPDYESQLQIWENYTDEAQLAESMQWVLLPNLEQLIAMVDEIELKTEEVKAIREKAKKGLEKLQEGFQMMLLSLQLQDETIFSEAEDIMGEAEELMNEYERALDELAREKEVEL